MSEDRTASPLLEPTLLTDLCEVTMAMSYLREDMTAPAKATLLRPKQVFRQDGRGDVIAQRSEEISGARPLLEPMMQGGQRLSSSELHSTARERLAADLEELPGPRNPSVTLRRRALYRPRGCSS